MILDGAGAIPGAGEHSHPPADSGRGREGGLPEEQLGPPGKKITESMAAWDEKNGGQMWQKGGDFTTPRGDPIIRKSFKDPIK